MAAILLDGVTIAKGDTPVVTDLTMRVEDGEAVVLLGPSGSGKSSILRAIAGLDQITSGDVLLDGVAVTHLPPASRDIAMVFQESVLFPFMTARRNVAFPLAVRGMQRGEVAARVDAEAAVLAIEHLLERMPAALSAGHQQLVQVARALVRRPSVFLMDEPFARLDPPTREAMRRELSLLQRGYGVTTVHATNDQAEAMAVADRIVVVEAGVIRQTASPLDIYRMPADAFVAGFVGQPPMSFLEGRVSRSRVAVGQWNALAPVPGGDVVVGVRAEDWHHGAGLTGRVTGVEWLGPHGFAMVDVGCGEVRIRIEEPMEIDATGRWRPASFHLFDPDTGRALFHA